MRLMLFKSLIAACALSLAVPGLAATGNAGSGGIPGVQQSVEENEVRIYAHPSATSYAEITNYDDGYTGKSSADFGIENFDATNMYIRIQINSGENFSFALIDPSTKEEINCGFNSYDKEYQVPVKYLNGEYLNGVISSRTEGTVTYTVSICSSSDDSVLDSSDHTVIFIENENFPRISASSYRISGDLNTEIPFQITVNGGALANQDGMQLWFQWNNNENNTNCPITGDGIIYNNAGYFSYDITSLQANQTFNFSLKATAQCMDYLSVSLVDSKAENSYIAGTSLNILIPITYSQEDIAALKQMAIDNPSSTDLKKFIDEEYYLNDWNSESGYNVGVVWSQDNPSRVREFHIDDPEKRVETLDLSALTELQAISINGTYLQELNLSTLSKLSNLSIYNTDLVWTDVSMPSKIEYIYGNTQVEAKNATPIDEYTAYAQSGTPIDLSAYAEVDGVKSVYTWYEIDPNTNEQEVTDLFKGDGAGKFIVGGTSGKYYQCYISNEKYGNWTLQPQQIRISRSSDNYSEKDIAGLTKLATDNPHITQLQEFVNTKGWEHENWDTRDDVICTDWKATDESGAYRLTHLRIELPVEDEPKTITSLDLSAFTELEEFECERWMTISELDLSNNTKLKHLHVFSPNLESIDASKCPDLEYFIFRAVTFDGFGIDEYEKVKLNQINLENSPNLRFFEIEHVHIPSFDFSNYPHLESVTIDECHELNGDCLKTLPNGLRGLYLPGTTQFGDYRSNLPASISELDLSETTYDLPSDDISGRLTYLGLPRNLESFDLSKYPNLRTLEIGFNVTLKYSQLKGYRDDVYYNGSSIIELQSLSHPEDPYRFENGDIIDLSSEAFINEKESIFLWINVKDNTEETEALKPVEGRPGVFVLDSKEEVYGEYRCKIMNPKFCEITDINYYSGWQMETTNIYVETGHSTSSNFHEGDVAVLEKIVNDSNSAELHEWWNNGAWQSNKNSERAQATWNNEEPRRLTELYLYSMYEEFPASVDLSDLDRLEILSLAYNYVSDVTLPEETGNLRSLMLAGTQVNSLIVAPYTALEYLDVTFTPLQALDLSHNANLKELYLNGTELESIEITNPEIAAGLVSYGVPGTAATIDLYSFPNLKKLSTDLNTTLRFSDVQTPRQLEDATSETYYYIGNITRLEGFSNYGSTLNFQDEMTIGGQESSITWSAMDPYTGNPVTIDASGESYLIPNTLKPHTSITAQITNPIFPDWKMNFETKVYSCDGDANLDKKVNVADITATVSYCNTDEENMIERFGWEEANVNYDEVVDVADIVGIVNIIQNKPVTKASTLRDAYQPTVLLELDDKGFLTMTSQVPVAGIQLEFAGATAELPLLGEAAHLTQASTLKGDTLRTLGYSMDGKTIPAGKTVIMQLPAGVKLLKAAFSDAEATSLKAEGDILPTAIETIQTADQAEAVRNYPNPFSGSTTFSYTLKEPATKVAIQIFSTSGAQVETLEGLPGNAGLNRYTTGIQLPGGIYYYRLLLDGKAAGEANTMMIK